MTVVPLSEALVVEVARNMRASDIREVSALSPGGVVAPADLAAEAVARSRWGAVVLHQGRPAVAMGAVETWPGTANAWLIATDDWRHCWRTVVRWLRSHLGPTMRDARVTCAWVFALEGRPEVDRLLAALGFKRRGIVPRFGARDEPFALWSLTGSAR